MGLVQAMLYVLPTSPLPLPHSSDMPFIHPLRLSFSR